jgi:ribosome-binding protein aMBF1 (putative translation factor)
MKLAGRRPEVHIHIMPDSKNITGGQMRAARAFLRWSADDLAKKAKVGVATIRRAEAEDGIPNMLVNNMEAIRRALEAAGIEFKNDNAQTVTLNRRTRS